MFMRKEILMVYLMLFSACSITDDNKKNNNESFSKKTEMESCHIYPDSLTDIQKKCVVP